MDQDTFQRLLHGYFDRELDATEREQLMDHLRECPRSRWEFKLYRKMFQVMEQMEVAPPKGLPRSIMDRLPGLELLPFSLRSLASSQGFSLAAAAVFMMAVVVGWNSRGVDPTIRPMTASVVTPSAPSLRQDAPLPLAPLAPSKGPIRVVPEGRVEVLRKGALEWAMARPGDRIHYEDRLRTGPDGTVRLEYPDRAYLKVRASSQVQVLDSAIRVFQGDAWIKVQKKGRRFEARTPNAVASVRGTIYSVHVERVALDRDALMDAARAGTRRATVDALPAFGSNASASAAGAPLALAAYLREALMSSYRTEVQVFESTVAVSPLDPRSGRPTAEQLVHAGEGVDVDGQQLASVRPLEPNDYFAWNLPPPQEMLTRADPLPAPAEATSSDEAPGEVIDPVVAMGADDGVEGPGAASAGRPGDADLGYGGLTNR